MSRLTKKGKKESKIYAIMISGIGNKLLKEYFPLNLKKENIKLELNSIADSFQNQGRGNVETKSTTYHYRTYYPSQEGNTDEQKLFIVINADNLYPDQTIKHCFNSIYSCFSKNSFEFNSLSLDTKNSIDSVFKKFEYASKVNIENNEDDLTLSNERNNDRRSSGQSMNESDEQERLRVNNYINENENEMLGGLMNGYNEEKSISVMFERESNFAKKWKILKIIYIFLCLIIALGAYGILFIISKNTQS